MPRKRSVKKCARQFETAVSGVQVFADAATKTNLTDSQISWVYEYAIIALYRALESMILDALVGAINNDTAVVSKTLGVKLPPHLRNEVCRFLVTGTGYFDFKGRNGLIRTLKKFVPESHYLVQTIKKQRYKPTLEQLSALRNFATHDSPQAKRAALAAIGLARMSSVGAWLKRQQRLNTLTANLGRLAKEIRQAAPY